MKIEPEHPRCPQAFYRTLAERILGLYPNPAWRCYITSIETTPPYKFGIPEQYPNMDVPR